MIVARSMDPWFAQHNPQIHTLPPTYIGGERGVREREEGRWEREGGRGKEGEGEQCPMPQHTFSVQAI